MTKMKKYFEDLKNKVNREYEIANEARAKGLDPVDRVEIPLAMTMAEKSVGLISTIYPDLPTMEITKRILELEDSYGQLGTTVSFVIAREISEEKFCKFENKLEAIDAGIRVGFAYITLGVVASPIEGYTGLKLGKTKDGKDYFIASFSGPIRSAGTTSVCVVLMLIDYLREYFGYAKYDASKEEVKRYIVENRDFHERVSNLQYFPTEEEMEFLASRLPIQIDGDPTSKREVSNYKDLPRVETNFIRGGMCLVFSEGLAQKAGKALGRLKSCKDNGLEYSGFDWLEDYLVLHKKREGGKGDIVATYIKDLVAGRPVYGHPGRSGGFRFRYGRGRTSGFSAVSVHPATMGISGGFLSHGTQLKLEKPTKGCIVTSCDSIDGPIVKLKNGSVRKLDDYEEARKLYGEVEEIIYLGDILFPIGDVIDRNADLVRPGYVEEWWKAELDLEVRSQKSEVRSQINLCLDEVMKISEEYGVALHPAFIFYWSQISGKEFIGLLRWLNGSVWRSGKLVLNWEKGVREKFGAGKRALEILGVEHEVILDNVVVDGDARALLLNLGKREIYNGENLEFRINEMDNREVLEIVNELCEFEVKDKAGTFIGARMGRPEKAKLRKLAGSPNVLFPVGDQGGRLKNIYDAIEKGFVKADFPIYRCGCGEEGIYERCGSCGGKGKRLGFCRKCGEIRDGNCKLHGEVNKFWNRKVDVKKYFDDAVMKLGYESHEVAPMIKGVKNLNSESKIPENLAKGILRAKFGLSVNKDGTVRYDVTEIPLTHFKPREIGVNIEKLKGLGYLRDVDDNELVNEEQILELKPHDIVLPNCSAINEVQAGEIFFNIANFIDEELERFYGMERFYNLKDKGDLVGKKVVCMAPHNCAGVIGRIIGFANMQGLLASPCMHAAMRRDCDGDEAAVMLLMDVLLNFSREFLPSHRGGSQDAPLVLNARIRVGEVDDQILFFETCEKYPLELYKLAEDGRHSSEVSGLGIRHSGLGSGGGGKHGKENGVELIRDRMKLGIEPFVGIGWTHDTNDFNLGNNNGVYKTLPTMKEKVAAQMELVRKIRAVDTDDVARLILERHFIRDIRGNLRKFAKQQFRCAVCNAKFRRPPLIGVCTKCKGKLIFTISEGSVRKYLEPAMELVRDYKISSYTKENMELIRDYIERIFGKGEKQVLLDNN
ncbi:DNA polymerase II large subunit [Candidatus Pacearchaeota archaeon]|nr:DNA polymerase II large subunit [Candidatus Pacearchaeota archaeon]